MAVTVENKYGTSNQTITCSIASLTTGSARSSTAIDNSSTLYQDVLVQIKILSGLAATSASGIVNIYVYASDDGGTTYGSGAGTDAAITLTVPPNLVLIGTMNVVANATTYKSNPFSVAKCFNGQMPQFWGIVIENKSGGTLAAVEASHAKFYQGVYQQTV